MREKPPIALLMERLRRRAHLSQRGLAELAGISAAAIARIERGFDPKTGGPVKPETETLRRTATALATSADGDVNRAAQERIYRDLLTAAGYDLPGDTVPSPSESTQTGSSSEDRADRARRTMRQNALSEIDALLQKVPEASIALTDLSRGVNDWDDEDYEYVLTQLRRLARRYGRPQVAC